MKITKALAFLATQSLLLRVHSFSPYYEQIRASGLLGSHFGQPGTSATFDYIVVGGGTAGLTVATRLAENGSFSVAVIEAGGFIQMDNGPASEIPSQAVALPTNPLIDWLQFTTLQAGLANRSIHYSRGKTLAGSSSLNAMWYQRGSTGSYAQWAEAVGDSSYEFNNFLPFFKRSIKFTPPNPEYIPANASILFNTSASGSQGALHVGYPRWLNGISSWFSNAGAELGVNATAGFLDGNLLGRSYITLSIDSSTQTRSTSETSSLRQALVQSPNLVVYKTTLAKQIIFDSDKKAASVLVETGGLAYLLNATKEIVLSSGAFRSPQLLQVSGIGNETLLKSLGIPVISNLPGVGQNLQDNLLFGTIYESRLLSHSYLSVPSFAAQQLEDYMSNRTGIMTNTGSDFIAFERFPAGVLSNATRASLDANYASDWPEAEYTAYDGALAAVPVGKNYYSLLAGLLCLFSRGSVTINSTDTSVNPIVDTSYLSDPRDKEQAIAAFKQTRAYARTNALQSVTIGEEYAPGLAVSTDEEILAYVMETAYPFYHASCTCKMGKASDPMAVIDSRGRVFGVDGLRVIDVSSFPLLTPGQPQATVYGLAEKLAAAMLSGA